MLLRVCGYGDDVWCARRATDLNEDVLAHGEGVVGRKLARADARAGAVHVGRRCRAGAKGNMRRSCVSLDVEALYLRFVEVVRDADGRGAARAVRSNVGKRRG